MAKHRKTPPKHRAPRPSLGTRVPVARISGTAVRNTVVLGSLAAAATGSVVTGGVLLGDRTAPAAVAGSIPAALITATPDPDELADRTAPISRSDRRTATDPLKQAVLAASDSPADAQSEDLSEADPRTIARALLAEFGFGEDQFSCLDALYVSESGWRVDADNPSSSAYGIPQALPGSKMASAGADWATNPVTQIRWGLGYIQDRYGTPCGAWAFKQGHNWY